jgi:hypothetical protein
VKTKSTESVAAPDLGDAGDVCAAEHAPVPAADVGRSGRAPPVSAVRAAGPGRRRHGLPQRLRQAAPAELEQRDDHPAAPAGARAEPALREPAAALPARPGPGRLRSRLAGPARRGRAAVGVVDRAAQGGLASRVRALEDADGGAAALEPSPPELPRQAAADPAGGGGQSWHTR